MIDREPARSLPRPRSPGYVSNVVTRIHKTGRGRLFLREHRKAKGLSAEYMAGRLGIERESLLRLERQARTRCTPEKQAAYADALGIEPAALWRPPGAISLDDLVADQSDAFRIMAADVLQRMTRKG